MYYTVLHESKGRLRIHLALTYMSLHDADLLEYKLRSISKVRDIKIYDRTADAVIFLSLELSNQTQLC